MARVESKLANEFLEQLGNVNKGTARTISIHLAAFEQFVKREYRHNEDLDSLVEQLMSGNIDLYDLFSKFVMHEVKERVHQNLLSTRTLNQRVKHIKHFLEANDVTINHTKFRMKIKLPKEIKRENEGITKDQIREILAACDDIRLKTYVMFLASTGWRASEALSVQLQDIDFDRTPVRVNLRGENAKTRTDRHTYLTQEMATQLKSWLDFKYRERTIKRQYYHKNTGKIVYKVLHLKPVRRLNDYVFMPYHHDDELETTVEYAYKNLSRRFGELLDRMNVKFRHDGKRREVSLHSFRHFVYTTIDGLGQNQFAEYFIGHANSTYWRKPESEKIATFLKIEPYLTFMDYVQLQAKGADMETKLEQNEDQLRAMREQLGSLFQIMAIEDSEERQKRLSQAAKGWINKGMYRPKLS
jgi:integrase